MILALSLPLINIMHEGVLLNLTAFNISDSSKVISNNYYVSIAILIIAIVAAYSIVQFKNRLLQIKLGALISLLVMITMGLIYLALGDHQNVQLGKGVWALLFSLVCNFLANFFIRKDDKLVRDADRLR